MQRWPWTKWMSQVLAALQPGSCSSPGAVKPLSAGLPSAENSAGCVNWKMLQLQPLCTVTNGVAGQPGLIQAGPCSGLRMSQGMQWCSKTKQTSEQETFARQ